MSATYKYRAFISYSHADEKWARWLQQSLETYRTPKYLVGKITPSGPVRATLSPVFRDREELTSSADLSAQISRAIEDSESLIVICSPTAAQSRWVGQEVELFKRLGRSNRIFCLIVEGDPAAGNVHTSCFPAALRQCYDNQGKLLEGTAEPMAADVRNSADGKSLARLKVIAGLLGVGLDELRQRELHRRQRRLIMITTASVLAAAFATLLAFNAILAREEAQQRREQAENLLEFMVVDLRDSLTPLGRLDLLESVGQRAMDYFATVELDSLSDVEMLHQARVITQIGEIHFQQLEYDSALASFMDAYERSRLLQAAQPLDGERLFNRGQAEFWVGYVHWMSGDGDQAALWLKRYLATSEALAALDPRNLAWRREVAFGHHNLGVLAVETEQPETARPHFELALQYFDEIQELEGTQSMRSEIADAVSYLGDAALTQGDLRTAMRYYQRSAGEKRAISNSAPEDLGLKYNLAHAWLRLGNIYTITGDSGKGLEHIDRSITLLQDLVTADPSNRGWQASLVQSIVARGFLQLSVQDWSGATESVDTAAIRLAEFVDEKLIDMPLREVQGDNHYLAALLAWHDGNLDLALTQTIVARDIFRRAIEDVRASNYYRGKLAIMEILRAQILLAGYGPEQAQEALDNTAAALAGVTSATASHYTLDPWLRYLIVTGATSHAAEVRDVLTARSYRPMVPWPDNPPGI